MRGWRVPVRPSTSGRPAGTSIHSVTGERIPLENGPLRSMLDRFDAAAEHLGLDAGMVRYLKTPQRQVIVSIPTRLDDGTLEVYTAYRVIHNRNRGRLHRAQRCPGRPDGGGRQESRVWTSTRPASPWPRSPA